MILTITPLEKADGLQTTTVRNVVEVAFYGNAIHYTYRVNGSLVTVDGYNTARYAVVVLPEER